MNRSLLVRLLGFPATLIHGDTLVLDRWLWLRRRLPKTANGEKLIDIGCGTGAFTIGAARRGYEALGLSWEEANQKEAQQRARICRAGNAAFEVLDVRQLDVRKDWLGRFDVAICLETIEHVLDDLKLMEDITACLRPGGRLLLTTPYYHYRAITAPDNGPFCRTETGWHVRRGYQAAMLLELCQRAGLLCEEITYCSGFLTQKATALLRVLAPASPVLGWLAILPLRFVVPLFDRPITRLLGWPYYTICLEALKPRYGGKGPSGT